MKDLWVFGYGSLLWNPGFAVAETRQACLHGWRRSFCMTSIHHRGTLDAPGLVLALDRAGMRCATGSPFASMLAMQGRPWLICANANWSHRPIWRHAKA